MSINVNKVILQGRLGKDPEVRSTQDGKKIVTLSLATSEKWKDRTTGEPKENTEWHRVVIFNEQKGEYASRYAQKGTEVYVEGALKTRKYTTQGGEDRYVTEIVVGRFDGEIKLGAGGKGNDKPDAKAPAKDNGNHGGADHAPGGDDNLDQDIPF